VYFLGPIRRRSEEREAHAARDDGLAVMRPTSNVHLWKVTVSTGAETQITVGEASTTSTGCRRDGTPHRARPRPSPSPATRRAAKCGDGRRRETPRALTGNTIEETGRRMSPDNSHLFLADTNERFEQYYDQSCRAGEGRPAARDGARFQVLVDQARGRRRPLDHHSAQTWAPQLSSFQIDAGSRRARQLTDGAHFHRAGMSMAPGRSCFRSTEPTRLRRCVDARRHRQCSRRRRAHGRVPTASSARRRPAQEKVE